MARVVLDAGAVARLAHRFDVVVSALLEAGGFEDLAVLAEDLELLFELLLDAGDGLLHPVLRGHEVLGREDLHLLVLGEDFAGQRVEFDDAFDLVAEEVDADGELVVAGQDGERVAAQAELAADDVHVVPLVLHRNHLADGVLAAEVLALLEREDELGVLVRLAEAVDAAHARDDDHVATGEERARGRVPELVDLVVDVSVLGDVGVGARDVGLGLVVVVVADEVLDRVLREELLQLRVELGGERLVVREDERRPPGLLDDVRHRERLARAGDAEEGLDSGRRG